MLCENKKGVLLQFGLGPLLATLVTTELEISSLWQSLKGHSVARRSFRWSSRQAVEAQDSN